MVPVIAGPSYHRDGRFASTVVEAARFSIMEDVVKAADALNRGGVCDGS